MHRVIALEDLEIREPKLLQFAKYLAHQTLKSEEELSVEICGSQVDTNCFSLSECVKQMATQRSTQASEQIDEVQINSLVTKLQESHALDVFFSTL